AGTCGYQREAFGPVVHLPFMRNRENQSARQGGCPLWQAEEPWHAAEPWQAAEPRQADHLGNGTSTSVVGWYHDDFETPPYPPPEELPGPPPPPDEPKQNMPCSSSLAPSSELLRHRPPPPPVPSRFVDRQGDSSSDEEILVCDFYGPGEFRTGQPSASKLPVPFFASGDAPGPPDPDDLPPPALVVTALCEEPLLYV
ncbi:unnamed protein product, partial [Polarella glacialis]